MLKMYSQNDQTSILEILQNKILFPAQPWSEERYRIL